MPPDQLESTAVHELVHHVQSLRFPKLHDAPPWVLEGMAQYVAATHCRRLGRQDLLERIQESTLPHYGDGYRYFWDLFGPDEWRAVADWIEKTDVSRLPGNVPEVVPSGGAPLRLRIPERR